MARVAAIAVALLAAVTLLALPTEPGRSGPRFR